jgi:hypothetical protein
MFFEHFKHFFDSEGSVAVVAFEESETQAFFEAEQQAKKLDALGCVLMQLNVPTFDNTLKRTQEVMSQIASQQALQTTGGPARKHLLLVSESEQFTAERFNQLKQTIQSFPNLKSILFVSLSHDIFRSRKIDLAGQKIVFMPIQHANKFAAPANPAIHRAAQDQTSSDFENSEKEADHSLFHWSYLPHVLSMIVLVVLGILFA